MHILLFGQNVQKYGIFKLWRIHAMIMDGSWNAMLAIMVELGIVIYEWWA